MLLQTFGALGARAETKVVIITGAGPAFCAGADMHQRADLSPEAVMDLATRTVLALYRLPQPTIAKVAGPAVGAGANLALLCDFVLAAPDATFSQAYVNLGMSADCGGSWLLPQLMGPHEAARLLLWESPCRPPRPTSWAWSAS